MTKNKDNLSEPEIHARIKPSGSLVQMIALDSKSLLELDSREARTKVSSAHSEPMIKPIKSEAL